ATRLHGPATPTPPAVPNGDVLHPKLRVNGSNGEFSLRATAKRPPGNRSNRASRWLLPQAPMGAGAVGERKCGDGDCPAARTFRALHLCCASAAAWIEA